MKDSISGNDIYKARFVAKGYSQAEGIDYDETFSPTARMTSIRILLQLAAQYDLKIDQMDVKTAFLNAPIDCDIYIEQPEGFRSRGKNGEKLVWRLKKSLYGLKQSGRNWNIVLTSFLLEQDFIQSSSDPCVFTRFTEDKTILVIWVDDIMIAANSNDAMKRRKDALCKRFKMRYVEL